jgi:hypothetical protein
MTNEQTELNAKIAGIPRPQRMRHLKISPKGFPVPWFVAWIDGVPDFRVIDTPKIGRAVRLKLCWLCGQTLGRHMAFVLGPMCAVNRVSAEPPSHRDCAEYAIKACPFLTEPRMRRNSKDMPDHEDPGGLMITRNPGVTLLWVTKSYSMFRPKVGRELFQVGLPESVTFYTEGRPSTRAEVLASINSGLPILLDAAKADGHVAVDALMRQYRTALQLVPAA